MKLLKDNVDEAFSKDDNRNDYDDFELSLAIMMTLRLRKRDFCYSK